MVKTFNITSLKKLKKSELIEILKSNNLDIKGNKKVLIDRILDTQNKTLKNNNTKNKFYYKSYSKSFVKNRDKIVLDKEKSFDYNSKTNKGNYIIKEFGKTKENKKITKDDLEIYIKDKGLNFTIPDDIFKSAISIFNKFIKKQIDESRHQSRNFHQYDDNLIKPGSNDMNRATKISNISSVKKNVNVKKCKVIKQKYLIHSKNDFKKTYINRVHKINPNNCNTDDCNLQYNNLNTDYRYFMDNC